MTYFVHYSLRFGLTHPSPALEAEAAEEPRLSSHLTQIQAFQQCDSLVGQSVDLRYGA